MHVAAPTQWVSIEDLAKHYGPGPHPGTGSPQAVHRPGGSAVWTEPKDAKEALARLRDGKARGKPLWNPTADQVRERILNNLDHEYATLMWARSTMDDDQYADFIEAAAEHDAGYMRKGIYIHSEYGRWLQFTGQTELVDGDLDILRMGFIQTQTPEALETEVTGTLSDDYGSVIGDVMTSPRFATSIDRWGMPDAVIRSNKVFMGVDDGWQRMDQTGVAAAYFDRQSNGISMLTLGPRDSMYVDDDHAYIPTFDLGRTIAYSRAQGTASVAQTVRHEYGHHVWFQLSAKVRRDFTQSYANGRAFGVSQYASSGDPVEAFAEMFSLVTHPKWDDTVWQRSGSEFVDSLRGTVPDHEIKLAMTYHDVTTEQLRYVEEIALNGDPYS